MTQNTDQNVRTQSLQIAGIVERVTDLSLVNCYPDFGEVQDWMIEAEARGAEEQRRKDAEGQDPVAWQWLDAKSGWLQIIHDDPAAHAKEMEEMGIACRPVYLGPANVAALEARIAELEGENARLKTRVINAAEDLLGIETPCMGGDNFAVTICSHFEDCEGEANDNGWHESATKAYEEIKDAVLQHFRAALTREGGV